MDNKWFFKSLLLCIFSILQVTALGTVETISDLKALKKVLRTKTNVLFVFFRHDLKDWEPILNEVSAAMIGRATIVKISCSESPKACKQYKVAPERIHMQHFKNGKYNKDYNRLMSAKSLRLFLENPTGDIPWEEDPTAKDVVHMETYKDMVRVVQKSQIPILTMFYAPWCGHCNRLKPEYAAAATALRGSSVLAAMDVDREENAGVRESLNITGYPTLYYIEHGKIKFNYGGAYTKDGIIEWMKNPSPPKSPEPEREWKDDDGAKDILFLEDSTFEQALKLHSSLLVMFYAPWCGHCKAMKPDYGKAAKQLSSLGVSGKLAAVDATKHKKYATNLKVSGFPTLKYFQNGEFKFDANVRSETDIIAFMKDPKEPPPPVPDVPWSEDPNSKVFHVGESDFAGFVRKRRRTLVMFYAPWCGHCKMAKPEFNSAAEELIKVESSGKAALAAVDCTQHQQVCTAEGVSGYPTIKHYYFGKSPRLYSGERTAAEFLRYMTTELKTEL